MKPKYQLLYLLVLVIIAANLSAQDFVPASKWSYGPSIKAMETRMVTQEFFTFNTIDPSPYSFTYHLHADYKISKRLFLESGIGWNQMNLRFDQKNSQFTYTEANSIENTDVRTLQNYNVEFEQGTHQHQIDFQLITNKYDPATDYKEGDDIRYSYHAEYTYNYLNIPFALKYKIQKKRLSFYLGLGVAANFKIKEPKIATKNRQSGLQIDDNPYPDPIFRFQFSKRNELLNSSRESSDQSNSLFMDAQTSIGLLHEAKQNTFFLDLTYSRTLNTFYNEIKVETLGVTIGWRFYLLKKDRE